MLMKLLTLLGSCTKDDRPYSKQVEVARSMNVMVQYL